MAHQPYHACFTPDAHLFVKPWAFAGAGGNSVSQHLLQSLNLFALAFAVHTAASTPGVCRNFPKHRRAEHCCPAAGVNSLTEHKRCAAAARAAAEIGWLQNRWLGLLLQQAGPWRRLQAPLGAPLGTWEVWEQLPPCAPSLAHSLPTGDTSLDCRALGKRHDATVRVMRWDLEHVHLNIIVQPERGCC